MRGAIDQLSQGVAGVSLMLLMGMGFSINGEEGIVMKLTILIIIAVLGLMIPLFWITGTLTSIVYFCRHRVGVARKERAVAFNHQLGLTMADGGDPVNKGKKE